MSIEKPNRPTPADRFTEWALRLFGFVAALGFLGLGSILIFILLIGGLWAGFGQAGYVLKFFALTVYVYGTSALALWLGFRPSKYRGLILVLLVIPGVVSVVRTPESDRRELRDAARVFAANESPAQSEKARETLLGQGRRAGRQPSVDILMDALAAADSDAERVRLLCVLGEISGQHPPLLDVLRGLRQATAGDPERQLLHEVTLHALYGVNPYENMAPGQGAAERPPRPAACRP